MGPPIPVQVRGETVWVCCKGCVKKVQSDPEKYIGIVASEIGKKSPKGTEPGAPPSTPAPSIPTPSGPSSNPDSGDNHHHHDPTPPPTVPKSEPPPSPSAPPNGKVSRLGQSPTEPPKQKKCPVNGEELGSMGPPIPVQVQGETVWVCCKGCVKKVQSDPEKYIGIAAKEIGGEKPKSAKPTPSKPAPKESTNILSQSPDKPPRQKTCPVNGEELGSMGKPIPVLVRGETIWVCCKGCVKEIESSPEKYIEEVRKKLKEEEVEGKSKAAAARRETLTINSREPELNTPSLHNGE